MAKEDIGIVGKLRARYSWSNIPTSLSQQCFTNLEEKKSICGAAWAIKPVVGTTGKVWLQLVKVREWDNLDRVKTFSASLPNIWNGISVEAAPNDKILFFKELSVSY
jgi:hypothetical protein